MNIKQKLALLAATAGTTSAAFAGKVAEAITGNETVTGASADLYAVGGVVVGIVVVGVVFGAAIRLFRKGG